MPIAQIDPQHHTAAAITPTSPYPEKKNGIVWLDISGTTDGDLEWLEQTFHFHPLTIEDCRHANQRAKVEYYGELSPRTEENPEYPQSGYPSEYLFLSLTTSTHENGEVNVHEMEAFLGRDFLITVHRDPLPAIAAVQEHVTTPIRPDFLLYLITDHMVDQYFPLLDEVEDEIDVLEDEILEDATQATLHRIFRLKQQLVLLRKVSSPMRDVTNALASTRYNLIDTHAALYFRDAYDHLTRIYDLIETSRDLLGNALDAYLSTVSNRLNEVMKRLTLVATIFMPISFLAGLGGINFQQMPFNSSTAFVIFILVLVLVPAGMLFWFWRSRWV